MKNTNDLIHRLLNVQLKEIKSLERKLERLGMIKKYTGDIEEINSWKRDSINVSHEIDLRKIILEETKDEIRRFINEHNKNNNSAIVQEQKK